MAIEWSGIVASAVTGRLALEAHEGLRGKLAWVFSQEPLKKSLEDAFREAWSGFLMTLGGSFVLDDAMNARLEELFSDDAFRTAFEQLVELPFDEIETSACRDLFRALGPDGADNADFDAAWRALGRRFERTVAASDKLSRLLDLTRSARRGKSSASIDAGVGRLVEQFDQLLAVLTEYPVTDEDETLGSYRAGFFKCYRYADTRGLFLREKEGVSEGIQLVDIFVETPLSPIIDTYKAIRFQAREDEHVEDGEGDEPDYGAPLETSVHPRLVAEVLADERLVVVLGAPGSGKSTLMRCLGLALCRPEGVDAPLKTGLPPETVPLLLEMKEFASELERTSNRPLDEFLIERLGKDLPQVKDLLLSDRALVLLDGLDEVFNEDHRRWVSDQVWRLASRYPRARFVLTSRPHGYRAAPLPGPAPRFELAPFDDDGIARFFHGWFLALEREGAEPGAHEEPQARAQALTKEILGRKRLREMAENPLLCTLIILVHRSRSGQLPERRVVFYEAAVRTMVEVWERLKRSPRQVYDFPEPELMIRALAEVAWKASHELAERVIPGESLRNWLRESLLEDPEWAGERGARAVRDFLALVRDRTGLLIDLGADRYQFVHLSLHEWLVSFYIRTRLDESQSQKVVRHYLHAPQWQTTLRLLIGGATPVQADQLVGAILAESSSPWEQALCRDLRFICDCLSDKASVSSEMRAQIRQRLAASLSDEETFDPPGLVLAAAGLGKTPEILSIIFRRLDDLDWNVRSAAVKYFARLGADDETIRSAVFKRLADVTADVRLAAIQYIARVGVKEEQTRYAVCQRLTDAYVSVRLAAIQCLAHVAADDRQTRDAVCQRLTDTDVSVRLAAIQCLAHVAADDRQTRDAVRKCIDDKSKRVRHAAVRYFSAVTRDCLTFLQELAKEPFCQIMAQPKPQGMAQNIDAETRSTILSELASAVRAEQRRKAVRRFTELGAYDIEIHNAVLRCLVDKASSVRREAVRYFAWVGAHDEEIQKIVLRCLDDEAYKTRLAAVQYFIKVGSSGEEILRAVLSCLADQKGDVRRAAIQYFIEVGAHHERIQRAVFRCLDDRADIVRRAAVQYFAQGFPNAMVNDKKIRNVALQSLKAANKEVRSDAVQYFALVRMDDEEIRKGALRLLDDPDRRVRRAAVHYFTELGLDDEEICHAFLRQLDADADVPDVAIKTGDHQVEVGDTEIRNTVLQRLGNTEMKMRRLEHLIQVGADDVEICEFVLPYLNSDDPEDQAAAIHFLTRTRVIPDLAPLALEKFETASAKTASTDDRNFCEALGRVAAHDGALFTQMMTVGRRVRHFRLDLALRSTAEERDRLRRQQKLTL